MQVTPADVIACQKELASRSCADFLRMAWPQIDGEPYVHNWHIDAIGEHLQAVAAGELTRLLINISPGTSKSSAASVFFPAWLWGPAGKAHYRFLGASHEQTLATRDNLRTRRLVQSRWFQDRWPTVLTSDQNEKTYFENDKFGFRQSSPVASMTGKRGHVVVWDDPTNPEQANSPVELEKAIRVLKETLSDRLVSPTKSGIIIIMQRLNEGDVSGHILESDYGYEHLCLPMEFEPERKCYTSIGFEDPRTKEGELLFEERFPRPWVDKQKVVMGSYGWEGQHQQRPVPRGGAMFKRHWFKNFLPVRPAGLSWVRGWDLAATDDADAAWTRGVLMALEGTKADGYKVIIGDVCGIQGTPMQVRDLIMATAKTDGRKIRGSLPQDPGQAGKAQVMSLVASLVGYDYRFSPETGDKVTRAGPLAAQAEAGNVWLVEGDWNEAFIDELCKFPRGKWADQVDAASRALSVLIMEPEQKSGTVRLKL
jgi:predicted phage terminase large subunit-like protein